ncbi:Uma2 family endonuclease [Pontiella sp.]|uniref:Uma2 family endonuclease n=1 Tax=Pontiella sp. TaxID=2837462 RepID=UPI003566C386
MGERAFQSKHQTWDDYRRLPDGPRVELIGGEVFDMSPAPSARHQGIVFELSLQLGNFFKGKPCKPFVAPTDLKLSDEDVVQPDLMVVCDRDQIKETHVEGAPALVIEILSPSTMNHDRKRKMGLYARAGVKEVWLVSPLPASIEVFLLDGATYRFMGLYQVGDAFVSPGFEELKLDLPAVFDFPVDPGEQVYVVKEDGAPYGAEGE